jgi:multicomponent Na+:H+ antiporter subunit E
VFRRWAALFIWAYLGWILLTWTKTAEQLSVGAVVAALVALACLPLGDVARPWRLLDPRRLVRILRVGAYVLVSMVKANLSLSRRIWTPSRPLRPGMVIVTTTMSTDGGLTGVGVLTSLVVDNQLIDVDRAHGLLQYHGVWVGADGPDAERPHINGPLEDRLRPLEVRPLELRPLEQA